MRTPASPEVTQAFEVLVDAIAEAVARKLAGRLPDGGSSNQKLMSVRQAAEYLGRTPSSVRGLIGSRDIPEPVVKRIGGRVFLLKRELDAWISAQ
jgi:excisionase family DNA binding protein